MNFAPNDPTAAGVFAFGGAPAPASFKFSHLLGGLQLGYNWQFSPKWLVGIETDFDWTDFKGSYSNTQRFTVFGTSIRSTADENIKWFGTVRARLGYLPTDHLLAYITGGFAYGKIERAASYDNVGIATFITGAAYTVSFLAHKTCFAGASSSTATGWTLGGGLEYAIWKNVSVKAEYLYASLDGKSVTETAQSYVAGTMPASFDVNYNHSDFNIARVGLNYRF